MNQEDGPILLFDGICNLCNWAVRFVVERDGRGQFRFASLQSQTARRLLAVHGLAGAEVESVVLIEGEKIYIKSEALLRVMRSLSGGWPLLYGLIVIPRRLRDGVYDWLARNRYRWFGVSDSCEISNSHPRTTGGDDEP